MKKYELDNEYMNIVKDIINNNNFSVLKCVKHHNTTRMNHSLKVSYYSYKIARKLHLSYKEVARAGLLHDFYLEQVNEQKGIKNKFALFMVTHPKVALSNSMKYFELTKKEKNIIKTHMFPSNIFIPIYLESWLVCIVDKVVSTKEFANKFFHKLILCKSN